MNDSDEDDPLCALLRSKMPFSGLELQLSKPNTNRGEDENGAYVRCTAGDRSCIAVSCTPTPTSKVWIKRVLETHDTLQYLELLVHHEITPRGFLSDILRPVGSLSRLCELSVTVNAMCGESLHQIDSNDALGTIMTETSSLLSLQLKRVKFTAESMEQLVRGLRSNRTLTKLGIQDSPLNSVVSQAFINFLCTRTNEHHLRELCYTGTNQALLVDSLAMTSLNDGLHPLSVGSGLLFLTLSFNIQERSDAPKFFDLLSAQAHRIRLETLHLPCLHHLEDLDCLFNCLPKLVYLKELKVVYTPFARWARTMYKRQEQKRLDKKLGRACKANGSLQIVHIFGFTYPSKFVMRNSLLPLLLSNSSNAGNEGVSGSGANMATNNSPTANSNIVLFPHLFASAMQSRRMAPNWMLMGLVASCDCIGPSNAWSGKKRALACLPVIVSCAARRSRRKLVRVPQQQLKWVMAEYMLQLIRSTSKRPFIPNESSSVLLFVP
jgi:hypothetical protein